eukprot:3888647-Amphidinium_carterae.1
MLHFSIRGATDTKLAHSGWWGQAECLLIPLAMYLIRVELIGLAAFLTACLVSCAWRHSKPNVWKHKPFLRSCHHMSARL